MASEGGYAATRRNGATGTRRECAPQRRNWDAPRVRAATARLRRAAMAPDGATETRREGAMAPRSECATGTRSECAQRRARWRREVRFPVASYARLRVRNGDAPRRRATEQRYAPCRAQLGRAAMALDDATYTSREGATVAPRRARLRATAQRGSAATMAPRRRRWPFVRRVFNWLVLVLWF